uniref:hypothetical protein n=1 Tax=Candidatus Enterococcus willemsii TaxID=1857215 RepID=UPI00403F0615
MIDTKIQNIQQLSDEVIHTIRAFVAEHDINPLSEGFHAKLLKNCLEMKHISLSTLSNEELETVLNYWKMIHSFSLN